MRRAARVRCSRVRNAWLAEGVRDWQQLSVTPHERMPQRDQRALGHGAEATVRVAREVAARVVGGARIFAGRGGFDRERQRVFGQRAARVGLAGTGRAAPGRAPGRPACAARARPRRPATDLRRRAACRRAWLLGCSTTGAARPALRAERRDVRDLARRVRGRRRARDGARGATGVGLVSATVACNRGGRRRRDEQRRARQAAPAGRSATAGRRRRLRARASAATARGVWRTGSIGARSALATSVRQCAERRLCFFQQTLHAPLPLAAVACRSARRVPAASCEPCGCGPTPC